MVARGRFGEGCDCRGATPGGFWADGTDLYPDCGGGYTNPHVHQNSYIDTPKSQFHCMLIFKNKKNKK